MKRLIIFTDLDGTLLDHDTYSWKPAAAAIDRINNLNIPLILNSSKTIAEISHIRLDLGNDFPFIVENGGAVCISHEGREGSCDENLDLKLFGKDYQAILTVLTELRNRKRFRFRGFSDMSVDELAELTGLPPAQAEMAKERCCSEPVLWTDSKENFALFCSELDQHDLQVVSGGRFYHIMGNTDKGVAMQWLLENVYHDADYRSVALGDSPNDRPMLELADYAVVVKNRGKSMTLERTENVTYTREEGPTGWQIAIDDLFDQLGD